MSVLITPLKSLSQRPEARIILSRGCDVCGSAEKPGAMPGDPRVLAQLWLENAPMADRESLIVRCCAAVSALNQHHGWGLSGNQIKLYAEQIVGQVPVSSLEQHLAQVIGNFHADHRRVADLRDKDSADHIAAWEWVSDEIAKVAQLKGLSWSRDPVIDLDDLVQTVQIEVVRSLGNYRFESLLKTWLHSVTVQRLRRFHRDNAAAKRAVHPEPLEAALGQTVEWDRSEQKLLASALQAEIRRILAVTGDTRYAAIFLLRVVGDLSNQEIALRLHLHPSRVRALLKTARDMLRSDPGLRDWGDRREPEDDSTQ